MAELSRLLGLLFSSNLAGGWAISRSTSSVGERHSDTFSLPLLPKRAETFGGFDAQNGKDKGFHFIHPLYLLSYVFFVVERKITKYLKSVTYLKHFKFLIIFLSLFPFYQELSRRSHRLS